MKGSISTVIISNESNAYYNLAVEKLLLNASLSAPHLFLWQSKNAVVIGAHQNPYAECNLAKMQEDGVQLTRRISGGGAVYHDLGNLNFCFVCPKSLYSEENQTKLIANALLKQNINVELSGRNDLTVNGFKISGNAYYRTKQNCLHHGTLLIASDLTRLSSYLTPPIEKLEKSGVKSIKSRVINLSEVNADLTVEKVKNAIIEEFFAIFGNKKQVLVEDLFTSLQIEEQIQLISSREYLFAKWARQNKVISKRFDWGICYVEHNSQANNSNLKIITGISNPTLISRVESEYLSATLGASKLSDFESDSEYEAYKELTKFLREEL